MLIRMRKKYGGVLIFACLVLALAFTGLFTTAIDKKDSYYLGEDLRLDLSGVDNYVLRISTPTKTILREGSRDVFLYELMEAGDYRIVIDSEDYGEVYSFKVYASEEEMPSGDSRNNNDKVEAVNASEEIRKLNVSLDFGNSSVNENFSLNNSNSVVFGKEAVSGKIVVGEEVVWEEKIDLAKEDSIEIPYEAKEVVVRGVDVDYDVEVSAYNRVASLFSESDAKKRVVLRGGRGDVGVRYKTEAPKKDERDISKNLKEVVVSAPDYLGYKNVVTRSKLRGMVRSKGDIYVYWKEENRYLDFNLFDLNDDGIYDEIEWIVPHLSTQTFYVILINGADHLDENRNFVENIYLDVKEKDDIWKSVPENHYIRVSFEKELESFNDITIYAKSNSSGRVEVYERDGDVKIADFGEIGVEGYYKIYLDNLTDPASVFDLKIISGAVDFDLIIDPWVNVSLMYEDFESTAPYYYDPSGNWTRGTVDWDRSTTQSRCGAASAHIDSAGTATNYLLLDPNLLNLSGARSVNVSFWWYCDVSSDPGEMFSYDEYYSGAWNNDVYSYDMGNCASNQWIYVERMLPSSAFQSDFRIRFAAQTNANNEDIYIDCFSVVKENYFGGVPYLNSVEINTTDGSDKPSRDLNCFADIYDDEGDTINVSVRWYNGSSLFSTVNYNNDYSNGTHFVAVLDKSNLNDLETWKCSIQLTDGSDISSWENSSDIFLSQFGVNYDSQTCSGFWGFDCGTGPPETGGDNTFDSCSNGVGNDESVEEIYLNATAVLAGESLNVTCEYDPYTSSDDYFIWYSNGTGWRRLYAEFNVGSGNFVNRSVVFTADDVVGNHTVRCGIVYQGTGSDDNCTDQTTSSSYWDNDDLRFSVVSSNSPPTIPTSITCNGGSCDIEVNESVVIECSGSSDADLDPITYFVEAQLNLDTDYVDNTLINILGLGYAITDYANQTCNLVWGFNCGAENNLEGDNTFDACSNNAATDERVTGMWINSTAVAPGESLSITCEYETWSTDDLYIWYYNGTGWKTLSQNLDIGSTGFLNMSATFVADDVVGTHWIRCGLTYNQQTETDYCADLGSYYDNDDINFTVNSPTNPLNDSNSSFVEYNDISTDQSQILDLTIKVEVDSYFPNASVDLNTTLPDLRLEVYNGTVYKNKGLFGVSSYFGNSSNTTNVNFSITISDSDILNAWRSLTNQKVRVRASNMDYVNNSFRDEINYSSIWFSFGSYSWVDIGNHSDGANFTWNTLAVEKNQFDVDMRCEAIDLTGENVSDGWYSPAGLLDIVHNDIVAPVIVLNSPANGVINDTSRMPDFNFTANDDKAASLDCKLWMKSDYLMLAGENTSVELGVDTVIRPSQSLVDGDYEWWINCSDGENDGTSAHRNITIFLGQSSANASLFSESYFATLNGVEQMNVSLQNEYNVSRAFIVADSQVLKDTDETPADSDAIFYFSNIVNGKTNQLTIERGGNGNSMFASYSILESEYLDVCHIEASLGNSVSTTSVDISSRCPFVPANYNSKCFISSRNNAKSASVDNTCKGENDFMTKFVDRNTISFTAFTRPCGIRYARADIVCFNDDTTVTPVSTGAVHFSTGANFSIGKSVNRSNSFIIQSCREEEYGLEDRSIECFFANDSTITCRTSTGGTGGTAPQECEIYVVEFPADSGSSVVHHRPGAEIGNGLSFSTSFSPAIKPNSTALFCSYSFVNGEGTNNPKAEYPQYLSDSSTIYFKRGRTGNTDPSHAISCEVVGFPTKKDPIIVRLDSPVDNYADYDSDSVDLKFNATVESLSNLKRCSLWHNATGYWHSNQTKVLGGRSANVDFWLYGLSDVKFNWNIQCENALGDILSAKNDRHVILEKISAVNLTFVSPNSSEYNAPVWFNVSGDGNLTDCNLSINSEDNVSMTRINETYYIYSDEYLRSGTNNVSVTCMGENGRISSISKDFNFVVSFAPRVLRGGVVLADGSNSVSVPISVDYLANSFLSFTRRGGVSTPSQLQVEGVLNKNNITFSRYSSSGDIFIEWEVVESPNIYVRRGVLPFGADDSVVSVETSNFNLGESFIIYSSKLSSAILGENVENLFSSTFKNINTLEFNRGQTGTLGEISWQAIEWSGSSVQSGVEVFTGLTSSVSLSSVIDRAKSFLVMSRTFSNLDSTLSETSVRGKLNSDSIDFSRSDSDATATVSWFVVENLEFNVVNGSRALSGSAASNTGIPSVNSSRAFLLSSYSSTGTGTTFANNKYTQKVVDDTTIQFQKGTSSQTQTIEYNVIEVGVPLSDFIVLKVPVNKSYNFTNMTFDIDTKLAASSCKYSLDGAGNISMNLITSTNFNYDVVGLMEGNHSVYFYCSDAGGYEYKSELVDFNIDLTPPNVTLNSPLDSFNSSSNVVVFNFTASDDRGVDWCEGFVDGVSVGKNISINNGSSNVIETYLSNGNYDWWIDCFDLAGNKVSSEVRRINVSGDYSVSWSSRFYESSIDNFNGVSYVDLKNNRDVLENNGFYRSGAGFNNIVVGLSGYLGNNGVLLSSGSNVDFSSYLDVTSLNNIYLTWKAYVNNNSGDFLICSSGDDSLGGVRVSSSSGTWTGSCSLGKDVYLKKSDKIKMVLNAYNDLGSEINITHRWDDLKLSFLDFSSFKVIGNLYSVLTFPEDGHVFQEAEYSNFSCKVDCSIGECSNVLVTLQYKNSSGGWESLNNQGDIIFDDNVYEKNLGTILGGSVWTNFSMYMVNPSNHTIRCYSSYDYGNYEGDRGVNISVIRIPRAAFIAPTPADGIELPQDYIPINMSVNESILDWAILDFNGVNQTLFNSSTDVNSSSYIFFVNKTGLVNGDYNFKLIAKNMIGGVRVVERTVAIKYGDVTAPNMTLYGIENNTDYNKSSFNFEIYLDEYGRDCRYDLDEAGLVNMTRINNTYFGYNLTGVSDDVHNIVFYCRDSSYNVNSISIDFSVDTIVPSIVFSNLTAPDGANRDVDDVVVDFEVNELNAKKFVFNWNGTNTVVYDESLIGLIGLDNLAYFSEGPNNVYDYISGRVGNVNGATWIARSGHDADMGAFEFVRSESDYISMSTYPELVGSNFTILTWVKANDSLSEEVFLSFDDSSGNTLLSLGHSAGSSALGVNDGFGWKSAGGSFIDGVWHQVGFSFVNASSVSIILDGKVIGSFSTSSFLSSGFQFSLGMGYNGATPSYFFQGYMDEVRIYNKVLNESELDTAYTIDFYKQTDSKYYYKTNSNWNGGWHFGEYNGTWVDRNFSSRTDINISNVAGSDLINYPVFLNLSDRYTESGNWNDIRFYNGSCADNQSILLDYDIEGSYGSFAVVWVRLPNLNVGGSVICMYYGDNDAVDMSNSSAVWNNDFALVYHMDEQGQDSTSNNRDRVSDIGAPANNDSFLGEGLTFSNNNAWSQENLAWWESSFSERSHEVIFETGNDINSRQVLFAEGGGTNGVMMYILNGQLYARWWVSANSVVLSAPINASEKYHAVMSYDYPGSYFMFLNGLIIGSGTTSFSVDAHPGEGGIGYTGATGKDFEDLANSAGHYFMGNIYEFRGMNNAVSGGFVNETYKSIFDRLNVVQFGASDNLYSGLVNGTYIYYGYAEDFSGWRSYTENRTLIIKEIDPQGPVVNLSAPIDSVTINSSNVNFNWTAVDNLDSSFSCDLEVGGVSYTGIVTSNNTLTNYLVTGLIDGSKIWNVKCVDADLNVGVSANRTVVISEPPSVSLNTENMSWLGAGVNLEYTPSDNTNLSSCSLILNGSVYDTIGYITNNQINTFDISGINETFYSWQVNCTDVYNLESISEERFFHKDLTAPNPVLFEPANDSVVYSGNVSFVVGGSDSLGSDLVCNLTLDGGIILSDFNFSSGDNYTHYESVLEGNHSWNMNCSDLAGNYNVTDTFYFSNYNAPGVSLESPEDGKWLNSSFVSFAYNPYSGGGVDNCSLYIDGILNQTNTTINNGVTNYFSSSVPGGEHNWTVSCVNSLGIEGFGETWNFGVDEILPTLTTYHPVGGDFFDWNDVLFNFTYTDNLDSSGNCSIIVNSFSEANVAATNGSVSEQIVSLSDGNYTWYVECFDDANNSVRSFEKNFSIVAPPKIEIVSPANDTRTTNSTLNITYIPKDAAGITKCDLFFDGSLNQSKSTIFANQNNNFVISGIVEGLHDWEINCSDADLNVGSGGKYVWTRDITSPAVVLVNPLNASSVDANTVSIPFEFRAVDALDTLIKCDLYLDGAVKKNNIWVMNDTNQIEGVSGVGLGEHNWSVRCEDRTGNWNMSETWEFSYYLPDFVVYGLDTNTSSAVEDESLFLNYSIGNIGNSSGENVLVELYLGHPSNSGVLLDSNNVNLSSGENLTFNYTTSAKIGNNEFYVFIDRVGSFSEDLETNNDANVNVSVGAWQFFYGDIDGSNGYMLATGSGNTFNWSAVDYSNAKVFVSDLEASISWSDLLAFGRDKNGVYVSSDYSELDGIMSMNGLNDSVSEVYLSGGVPVLENTYNIFGRNVTNVPDANSTDNSNFRTGILWDSSDSSDVEFDSAEREDLVFVSLVNKGANGKWGNYDYEMRVPAMLREYSGPRSEVVFYVEI